jgi:hypothetical protein
LEIQKKESGVKKVDDDDLKRKEDRKKNVGKLF